MAEAARKVYPMNTFVAYLRGVDKDKQKKNIVDMLSFVTQKDVDDDFLPYASALSKAWIYEQHPELAKMNGDQVGELGQSVSVMPMPEALLDEAGKLQEALAASKAAIAAQAAKIDELEAALKEKNAKLAVAQAKANELDEMKKAGDSKLEMSGNKLDEYTAKLEQLLAKIDEVKKTGLVVAGPAGAAAGAAAEGGEAAAAEGGAGGPEVGGEPAADFGFGSDPFADSSW